MRGRQQPPIPQPARPSAATNDINYLSAQVQQILALVLPAPVVTVLAAISDLLYRLILGRTNEPPTYASTLLPPVLLVVVTYLSFLLIYRSIKSMFSMIIFSIKWTVVLGLIAVLAAYHLGNGDVRQGAQSVAANTEGITQQIGSAVRQYPGMQQITPYLSYMPQQLGLIAGALPALQGMSTWLSGQGNTQGAGQARTRGNEQVFEMRNPAPRTGSGADGSNQFRGYRDVRPSRQDPLRERALGSDTNGRLYNWMGMGGPSTPPLADKPQERSRRNSAKAQRAPESSSRKPSSYDEREALNAGVNDVVDRISRFFGGGADSVEEASRRRSTRQ